MATSVASSSSSKFKVFVSHAKEDKKTIAIPLREKLMSHGISTFVDKKDIPTGVWFSSVLTPAMENADIAIVILSPEFVARGWPMKELLCFVRRAEAPLDGERKLSAIIPVFYRLSIKELYDEPRTDRLNANGKSLYRETRFFERMDNGDPEADIPTVRANLRKMHGFQGVENDEDATNDLTPEMEGRRNTLLNRICDEVLGAAKRQVEAETTDFMVSNPKNDEFLGQYYTNDDTSGLVLDFEAYKDEDNSTLEGDVLRSILDSSKNQDVICIRGLPGVGKTSLLQGLSSVKEMTQHFKDGIYLFSLGANATRSRLISALCKAIEDSGGKRRANHVYQKTNCIDVISDFRLWFSEKKCLFMVDDVWETLEISSAVIHELLKLHRSGLQSKLLFTARSTKIAAKIDVKMCFLLNPQNPTGVRSRAILLLYSGIESNDLKDEDEANVVKILTRCAGLPLFVKIAGIAVKALTINEPMKKCDAFHLYAQDLDLHVPGWLNTDVDLYKRLALTLDMSVRLLEKRRVEWGFSVPLTVAQMYRRLSVLHKQSYVPMPMLRYLWELRSEAEARFVAREFEQIGLADIYAEQSDSTYVQFLGLHDSLHEYAVGEARKLDEETLGHRKVIQGYRRGLEKEDGFPVWWSTRLEADGYIHNHLCRHLLLLGLVEAHEHHHELIMLLLEPEWTVRSFEVSGILGLERDYALGAGLLDDTGQHACRQCFKRYGMPKTSEVANALRTISGAAKISHGFNAQSPGEVCFQLYGRLIFHAEGNVIIKEYLARMDGNGSNQWLPWLSCNSPFLIPPGGPTKNIIHLGSPVKCMIKAENAEKVYCGCADGTVAIVNVVSGTVESKWSAHPSEVFSLAVCHTSRISVLLTGSCFILDCLVIDIKVWDLESVAMLKAFKIVAKDFDTDTLLVETYLNITGETPDSWKVERWEVRESSFEGKFLTLDGSGHIALTKTPDDEQFVITVRNHSVVLIESSSGQVLFEDSGSFFKEARFIQILPSGERIAFVTPSKVTHALNMHEGAQFMQTGPIFTTDIVGIPDRRNGETGSDNFPQKTVYVAHNGTLIKQDQLLEGHTACITSFSIDTDGNRIVSGSLDNAVHVLDIFSQQEMCNPLRGHTSSVSQVLLHYPDNSAISCSLDGSVRVWDLKKATLGGPKDRHSSQVTSTVFTPDGMKAVSGSADHTIRVWDVKSGKQDGEPLKGHSGGVTSLTVTSDAKRIVSVSWDTTVRVWNLRSRRLLHTFTGHNSRVDDVVLTPSDKHAVTCSLDGTVRAWELANSEDDHFVLGQYQHEFVSSLRAEDMPYHFEILSTVSPESSVFLTTDDSNVVTLSRECKEIIEWNLETREEIKRTKLIEKPRYTLNSRSVIIICNQQNIWYVDAERKLLLGIMEAEILSWSVSPDGKTIIVGLDDGQVALMTLRTDGKRKFLHRPAGTSRGFWKTKYSRTNWDIWVAMADDGEMAGILGGYVCTEEELMEKISYAASGE